MTGKALDAARAIHADIADERVTMEDVMAFMSMALCGRNDATPAEMDPLLPCDDPGHGSIEVRKRHGDDASLVNKVLRSVHRGLVLDPSADLIVLEESETEMSLREIGRPDIFLLSDRGIAWASELTSSRGFYRYYRHGNDGPMERETTREIGEKILDALGKPEATREDAIQALEEHFDHGNSPDDEYHDAGIHSDATEKIERLKDELSDLGHEIDEEAWEEAVKDHVLDLLADDDDSEVTDMLGDCDRVEIVYTFKMEGYHDDCMIQFLDNGSTIGDLVIDANLQHSLSCLGYGVADYRLLSGNRSDAEGLLPGVKPKRDRAITPDNLRELVDNAGAQYFSFVVYAYVPVEDLLGLDLSQPITFDRHAIGAYNSSSGTYYDLSGRGEITLHPGEGELAVAGKYSPDEVCGLSMQYYYARICNAKPQKMAIAA